MKSEKVLDKLEKIRKRLEEEKATKERLKGKRDMLMESLKKFGVKSVEEAEDMVSSLEKEIEELNINLDKQVELFIETYPELFKED